MKTFKKIAISMTAASLVFTGCATTQLQTKAKLTKTVILDHSKNERKTIYLQVTNTAGSGGENMDLYSDIKTKLESKGYRIVKGSKDAEYGLFVNVLFANNLKEANAIKAASTGLSLGVVSGAAAGGGLKDSLVTGAVVALGSAVVGSALEDEVFRAVVDISIRDYQDNNIRTFKTINSTSSTISNVKRAGNLNQFAGTLGDKNGGGDMNSGMSEIVTTETVKDYEEYKARAFVEATKMDLKIDEALPILQAKISKQITNLF